MRTNSKLNISFLFILYSLAVNGQELLTPKKIKAKGEYIHSQTMTIFPESFDSYQRKDIYSFDKKKTNIGVVYENQQNHTTISIYVYPAGDGHEGRLRKEYQKSMQSIANFSDNGIHATQFAVRREGKNIFVMGLKQLLHKNSINIIH